MSDSRKAYWFAGATVLFWSTVATAFKLSLRYLDIYQLLLYSSLTSVLLLGAVLLVQGKFAALRGYGANEWRRSLLAGAMNPLLYYLILFKAYDLLPAQVAQPINYTWAITLTLLSVLLLKQRVTKGDVGGGIVCYAGVLVISTQGNITSFAEVDFAGVGLALLSTLVWAGYWIYNMRDTRDPTLALFLNFLCALPFVLIACVLFSTPRVTSLAGMAGAVYVGIFEMGLSFLCWSLALKLADNASRVSNLIFISPFLSLWFIHLLVGETIYLTTWLGLVLIVAGLFWQRLAIR